MPKRLPKTEGGLHRRLSRCDCPDSAMALGELYLTQGDPNLATGYFSLAYAFGHPEALKRAAPIRKRIQQVDKKYSKAKKAAYGKIAREFAKGSEAD